MDMLKLQDSFLDLVEELRLARITVAENESRIKELVEKCHDNERRLEEANAKNQSLLDERGTSLDNVNKSLEDEIKHLQAEKGKLQLNSEGWDKEMRALKEEVRTLQVAKYSLERTVREQAHKLETQSQAKTAHSQLVTETDVKCRDIARQMATYSNILDSLKKQVSEAVNVNERFEYTNKHQHCWIASLTSELEEKRREIVKLRAELVKKPEEAENQQRSLQMNMEKVERDSRQSLIKVEDMTLQLSESKRSKEVMAGQLQEAHELAQRCLTSKKRLDESLSVKDEKLSTLSNQCKELEEDKRKAQKELSDLSQKINDITAKKNKEIEELQNKWQKLNEDHETLQKAKDSLEELNEGWASKNRDLEESLLKHKAETEKANEGTESSKKQASTSVATEETQTPPVRSRDASAMTEGGLVGDVLKRQSLRDALVQTDGDSQCMGPRDEENVVIGAEHSALSGSPLCEKISEVTSDERVAEKENVSTVEVESVPEVSAADKLQTGADKRQCKTHCSKKGTSGTRAGLGVNVDDADVEIPAKVPRLAGVSKTYTPLEIPINCTAPDSNVPRDVTVKNIPKSAGFQHDGEGEKGSKMEVSAVPTDVNRELDAEVIVTEEDVSMHGVSDNLSGTCKTPPYIKLSTPDDSNARQEESEAALSTVDTVKPADAETVVIPSSYAQENTSPAEQECHTTFEKGKGSVLIEVQETETPGEAANKVTVQDGDGQKSKDGFCLSQGEHQCEHTEDVQEPILKPNDIQGDKKISKMDRGPLLNPLACHQVTNISSDSYYAATVSSPSSLPSPKFIVSPVSAETKTTSEIRSSWCPEYPRLARHETIGMPSSWCGERHQSLSTVTAGGAPVKFSPLLTAQQLESCLLDPTPSLLSRPVPVSAHNTLKSTREFRSSMAGTKIPQCPTGDSSKVQRNNSPPQDPYPKAQRGLAHDAAQCSSKQSHPLGLIKKDATCISGHVQLADTLDRHSAPDSRPCMSYHQPGGSGDAGDDTSLFSDDDDDNDIKADVANQIEHVQLFLSKDRLKRPKSELK
ncbi:uncharacterized protein [Diadema setosum]|uniref:uncharacterized protein n=1 Tax=Diadema setosum TaxID=31175 RepID=UPI003B3B948E